MRKLTQLIFVLACTTYLHAQNTIGLPDILNYSKQSYSGGAQNRQIIQDKKGILYFANNEGVMSFDGINWKLFPLPNKSIVRCIKFGPDGKLYVGGQDEFGYFSPLANGRLVYHSLKEKLPATARSFADVWEIVFYGNSIFFQTSDVIYEIAGNRSNAYRSDHWMYITACNNRLLAQDQERGLLLFRDGIWSPFLTQSDLPPDVFVTSITAIGHDTALLTTFKHGSYLLIGNEITAYHTPFFDKAANAHLAGSAMVNTEHIALATSLSGCYIVNKKGELIQQFSATEGLENNNVLTVFLDREKNIWLGLDNGIAMVAYNNAIKHIYPEYLNEGTGYAVSVYNDELYLGTSNGLYKTRIGGETDLSFVKNAILPVANTKGQVWNLSQVNGKLLMGHHDGAFMIENNGASQLDNSSGYWTFLPLSNVLPSSMMIAGTYYGIRFFDFSNNTFRQDSLQANFESARFVCVDNGSIWIAHPYKGIFRVRLNGSQTEVKQYKDEGVQSINGNYIFRVNNKIILTTEHGIFEYDEASDSFKASDYYNKIFAGKNIRYLKQDDSGNTWFVYDKILGVLEQNGKNTQIIYFPELTNKFVSGFEHVYPVNKNNIIIGGEKGFYHINYEQYKTIKNPLRVLITSVKAINKKDSLLFGGYTGEVNGEMGLPNRGAVSHSWNSFHFEYASPLFAQQANIEYSYMLEGFDTKWSEFSRRTEKEYTNLSAGDYTFKVKCRNNLGNESEVAAYSFTVSPPWYLSNWAYAFYIFLFGLAAYALYRRQRTKFRRQQSRHEEEQQRLQYLHQLELEKNEKEIVKLRNEKLEAEITHKNSELASVAMHLVQKGEMLTRIREQIEHLKKNPAHVRDSEEMKKILRSLSDEEKIDHQWEQFTKHFDNVHSDFFTHLKDKYGNLSPNELKLSAYLRMNLSTKEIAQLMNISVRGVEISRYRLRKKLGIPTDVNLYEFLVKA